MKDNAATFGARKAVTFLVSYEAVARLYFSNAVQLPAILQQMTSSSPGWQSNASFGRSVKTARREQSNYLGGLLIQLPHRRYC